MTTTNEMPYEEYKGYYLGRGITMPAQGIFEWNVYASPEDVAREEPLQAFEDKEGAMEWVDERTGGYEPSLQEQVEHGSYVIFTNLDTGEKKQYYNANPPDSTDVVSAAMELRRILEPRWGKNLKLEILPAEKLSPGEPHSIHGPERERLVAVYGTWAVGRAESICAEGDVACVEREAARLSAKVRVGSAVTPSAYYWSVRVDDTNEVAEKAQAYGSVARAVGGAKAYARGQVRDGHWPTESSYTIRVYEAPAPAEAQPFREEGVVQEHVVHGSELA